MSTVDLDHLALGPVRLVHGALADQPVDVLVNTANTYLQMSSGVSGALRAAGGMEIHKEAVKHAPQPTGRIVLTGAGSLQARGIYHAVLVDYTDGRGLSGKVITQVVEEVLARMPEDGFGTVAFPLFGVGDRLGIEHGLTAMVEGLEAAGREEDGGCPVDIVVRDAEDFAEARRVAKTLEAGAGRRAAESQLAEDYLAELMNSLGGDIDFDLE